MDEKRIIFDDLVRCVIDGDATAEEFQDMVTMMRDDPVLQRRYCLQMQVHALLTCHKGQEWPEAGGQRTEAGRRKFWNGWKVAAAVAVLLGGIAVWRSVPLLSGVADCRLPIADSSVSPVTLIRQVNVRGLDLPSELPGMLRLSSGEAVVRLGSGVQLTVLGPASLEVRDVMQVRLERGRLLANVPRWATGFRVRTADLDVCDLGTVFSVSVDWPVCDVFVFKGRVRVNEAGRGEMGNETPGDVVGICEAGEGVRAEAGERPVKFAADWPAAKKLFAFVRDRAATEKPAVAFSAAAKIADLWVEGFLPREMARLEAQRLAAASAPKIPFRKTAWVRPSAPAASNAGAKNVSPRQEANNMNKTRSAVAVLAAAAATLGAGTSGAHSDPVPVGTSPVENRHWETVYTNEVDVAWRWATNAVSAQLSVSGMNGTALVTNVTRAVSNVLWRAFAPGSPDSEDVYDLTLTFYGSGDTVVGALTSRLAVVKGAFGKTAVDPDPDSKTWAKVKEHVVIPYDAGWAESTAAAPGSRLVIAKVGGAVQTNALADTGGYFGWKLKKSDWGYGAFNLALTFPGTVGEWDAALIRPMDGTMIRMQ
jgi:hypothetical protein